MNGALFAAARASRESASRAHNADIRAARRELDKARDRVLRVLEANNARSRSTIAANKALLAAAQDAE